MNTGDRKYRIAGNFIEHHATDDAAFESAQGYTDGPGLYGIERQIDGRWFKWIPTDGVWFEPASGKEVKGDE